MWLTHGEYSQSPWQSGNEGKVENRTGNQGKVKNCTGTGYTFSEPLIYMNYLTQNKTAENTYYILK